MCWRIVVGEIGDGTRGALFALLTPEEQARARRFVRIEDRHSFTAAHGVLRVLLGAMLGAPPRSLAFSHNGYGKPRQLEPGSGIEFNMSHSGGIVLIGFARRVPIGIDVEATRPLAERAAIVRRYFHPGEAADFARISPAEADAAFFRCWSRKEAVVKALGLGMSLDLHRYRVACIPGAEAEVLAVEGEANPRENWTLLDLEPGPGYVGAVAARRRPLKTIEATFDPAAVDRVSG